MTSGIAMNLAAKFGRWLKSLTVAPSRASAASTRAAPPWRRWKRGPRPRVFTNESTNGVIGFVAPDPYRTEEYESGRLKPGVVVDEQRFYGGITIAGERAINIVNACGTCGFLFEKLADPKTHLDDESAVELLGSLEAVPDDATLARLAAILPAGEYLPLIVEAIPRWVRRKGEGDYLVEDFVKLFGLEAPDYVDVPDPRVSYYRLGEPIRHCVRAYGRKFDGLLFQFLVPLQEADRLNRNRIEHWKNVATRRPLTAFAFSAFDIHGPAIYGGDPDYRFETHLALKCVLLDGHHRVQAAAELQAPVRVLAMISRSASSFWWEDEAVILKRCGHQ
jgi:hypothetical protein